MGILVEGPQSQSISGTGVMKSEIVVNNLFPDNLTHDRAKYDLCGPLGEMPSNSTMQMKLFSNVGGGGGHGIEIWNLLLVLVPRVLIARPFWKALWLFSIIKMNHSSQEI
eukprot:Tbor_TRINITY_DN5557_c0_g1::TRINITY_DN5557_c0_g1_i6::g.12556::m.12556